MTHIKLYSCHCGQLLVRLPDDPAPEEQCNACGCIDWEFVTDGDAVAVPVAALGASLSAKLN